MMKKVPTLYEKKVTCSGCSACMTVCSQNAIKMQEDEEGFCYPVIDEKLCVGCWQCMRVCPYRVLKIKKKPKVETAAAIVTLYYNNYNYGGVAQAYALYKVLEKLGIATEVISYKREQQSFAVKNSILEKIKRNTVAGLWKRYSRKLKFSIEKNIGKKYETRLCKRRQMLEEFRSKIPHTEVMNKEQILEHIKKYDILVSGSDQIWKPGIADEVFLFHGIEKKHHKKVFSYASSVGVEIFPDAYQSLMKEELEKYNGISVRESVTAEAFSKLFGYSVTSVVDPTLLLERSDWEKLAAERLIEEPYIFCYLLGNSKKQRKMVEKLAKREKKTLVTLPHIQGGNKFAFRLEDWHFGDRQMFEVGLQEFFSLIKYSSMIVTDSFHATVFSIHFERPFWVLEKELKGIAEKTTSRIYELAAMTGLENRIWHESSCPNNAVIDYTAVKKKMEPYIEKSWKYLNDILGEYT